MPEEILKGGGEGAVEQPVDERPKRTTSWRAAFVAGCIATATTLVGVEKGVLEPQLEARQAFVVDSIAREDSIANALADSINAENVKPARYAAVRPEVEGTMHGDKYNPLYYHRPDEFVIVRTYRGQKGSTDTVLLNETFVEADDLWLLDVKARAVMERPPVRESYDDGETR